VPFTLGKKFRLTGREDFRRVISNVNLRQKLSGISLYGCANNLGYSRLGVVVPKKNIPGAVQRNYCKRVARELFRLHRGQLGSMDIIFVVRSTCGDKLFSVIRNILGSLIHEENFVAIN
jgi:ribonuclease P protein component